VRAAARIGRFGAPPLFLLLFVKKYNRQARFRHDISRIEESEHRNSSKMFAVFLCITAKH